MNFVEQRRVGGFMKSISLANELAGNSYPGRGIVIGKSADGKYAVTAYFIMGRSEPQPCVCGGWGRNPYTGI